MKRRQRLRCSTIFSLLALHLAASLQDNCIVTRRSASLSNFDCPGGYLLRVEWLGRLGNNLLQLANVLHIAEELQAEVIVPHRDFLNRHEWDLRGSNRDSCQIAIYDRYFFSEVCPRLLDRTVFSAAHKRQILRKYIIPEFRILPKPSVDTVVIHVRGGDVFTNEVPPPTYTQPPLIFYKTILQLPELARMNIIVCTEDYHNPVVRLLQKQYRKRLTIVTDLDEGIGTVLGARHLILGQSSFSEMLSMLAPDLKSMYVPFCSGRENLYVDLRQQGWGLPGYCFEYTNYIPIDGWQNTPEQLELMANLTADNLQRYPLPMGQSY